MIYPSGWSAPQSAPQPAPGPTAEDIAALRAYLIERVREEAYHLEVDLGYPADAERARKQIPILRAMTQEEILQLCREADLGVA